MALQRICIKSAKFQGRKRCLSIGSKAKYIRVVQYELPTTDVNSFSAIPREKHYIVGWLASEANEELG